MSVSIARRLAALEKAAMKAGVQECRHCFWGYLRVERDGQGETGRPGYAPVVIREWLIATPNGRLRELSDEDKARLVGWRDDDSWKVEDLRCRWCGKPVSCVVVVNPLQREPILEGDEHAGV